MDEHVGCLPCKLLGTNLDIDKGSASTNGAENKKTHEDTQGLSLEWWRNQTICVKEKGGRGLASIEGNLEISLRRLED